MIHVLLTIGVLCFLGAGASGGRGLALALPGVAAWTVACYLSGAADWPVAAGMAVVVGALVIVAIKLSVKSTRKPPNYGNNDR